MIAAQDTNLAAEDFAAVMSTLAGGVVLATCRVAGQPWGMTVTAFASVSVCPPTVLVSLDSATAAARAIAETGAFGISILSHDQVEIAEYGAAPGALKFLDALVEPRDRDSATPAIAHALAHVDCDVVEAVAAADHLVFFARVRRARRRSTGVPLLYHGRGYGSFCPVPTTERNLRCLTS